ncbi:MAG: disulfide bond formation protein B [Sneathiellaceae bacterium]
MTSSASASGPASDGGGIATQRSERDRPGAVRQGRIALAVLGLLSAAMLLFALVSQYGFGLAPCTLCHWQRWAHIAVIALAAAGLLAGRIGGRAAGPLQGVALAAITLGFLAGAAIAGFHVGVELHWWEGTSTCGSGGTPGSVDALKAQLMAQPLVRCDEVAFSVAGISMAGWNGIGSLLLALAAAFAARRSLTARAPGG